MYHIGPGPFINAPADAICATYAACCVTGYVHAIHALRDDETTFRVLPENPCDFGGSSSKETRSVEFRDELWKTYHARLHHNLVKHGPRINREDAVEMSRTGRSGATVFHQCRCRDAKLTRLKEKA
jgi:hypothetical protein